MAKTLVGVFDTEAAAQNVVRELQTAGIQKDHLHVRHSTEQRGAGAAEKEDEGWTDKVANWFGALFDDDADAKQADNYAEAWRRGHVLVVADVEAAMVEQTVAIMNRAGAVDVSRRAEQWKNTGYTGSFDRKAKPYTPEQRTQELASHAPSAAPKVATQSAKPSNEESIAVVQEEVSIGKRVVQRGGVRIHSYVQERPVEEVVRLREERVSVQRRPVNRPAEKGELGFKERSVDVVASAEEAVVEKRARVVEEVVIGKNVTEHSQKVQETVRRKDVKVETIQDSTKAPASR